MRTRLLDQLERLENMSERIGEALAARVDRIIQEAGHLAVTIVLCPHCKEPMIREYAMLTCPLCGLSLSDSDEPTGEFSAHP